MNLQNVINLGMPYLILGGLMVGSAAVIVCLGYVWGYRILGKGTKRFPWIPFVKGGVLLIYMGVVLGGTLLSRRGGIYGGRNLQPFQSILEAWNYFSFTKWSPIFLNILMFVPLGILLPWAIKKCQVWWWGWGVCFGISFLIELLQYMTGRGSTDIDDLIYNTLGGMIGYGIWCLLQKLRGRILHQESSTVWWKICLFQLPLLVTLGTFGSIFTIYDLQELGNLEESLQYPIRMSQIQVTGDQEFSMETTTSWVYDCPTLSKAEALDLANSIFAREEKSLDEERINEYENTLVLSTQDSSEMLWIDYQGPTISWSNFQISEKTGLENLSETQVRDILLKENITLPENAKFAEQGDGNYEFESILSEDSMWEGQFQCRILGDQEIESYDNRMIHFERYKEYPVISQQKAYEQIKKGKFNFYNTSILSRIQVQSMELTYEMDTKGYYQPVWNCSVLVNGEKTKIIIPAI